MSGERKISNSAPSVIVETRAVLGREQETTTSPIIVLDIDEILFDSASKHYQQWQDWINDKEWGEDTPRLVDLEEFLANGGTRVYLQHFIDNPHLTKEDFTACNVENTTSEEFNQDMELIEGAQEAVNALASLVMYYLTARPTAVRDVTLAELIKYNFPNVREDNVFFASNSEAYLDPRQGKLSSLLQIKEQNPGKTIILIDDSVATCQEINDFGDPQLKAILFAGAFTDPKVYPQAKNWDQIQELIKSIIQDSANN